MILGKTVKGTVTLHREVIAKQQARVVSLIAMLSNYSTWWLHDKGDGEWNVRSEKMVKSKRRLAPEELQNIPGVGPSLEKDLTDLGYSRVSQLRGSDPDQMYEKLCTLRKGHIDRCVLYVFRCAVYYASNSVHDPDLLKWWNWKHGKSAM